MPRLEGKPNVPGSAFRQIMALRPEIAMQWNALDEAMRFSGILDAGLKEEVRRMVAQHSGCRFCASLGEPQESHEDPRLAAAVAFGKAAANNPTDIAEEDWQPLKEHFTDEEIVELVGWISFMFASEMIGAIMKLEPATPELKTMYTKWISKGIEKSRQAAS